MTKRAFPLLLVFLLLTVGSFAQFPLTGLNGVVTSIVDSRTITVRGGSNVDFTIRLQAIETPREDQPLDDTVRKHLSQLVLGKTVLVKLSTQLDKNLYSGKVLLNGVDISLQMLRDGAAWYVEERGSLQSFAEIRDFQANESEARNEKRGVWGVTGFVTPSELQKLAQQAADQSDDSIVAQAAWATLGPSVEGVFSGDSYLQAPEGDCGGQVVRVIDGDTVKILSPSGNQTTVRLAGIDAPEKSQSCGLQSKEHLSNAILGRWVGCTSNKKDRYSRTIGKISFNGNDVNKMMIADGYAWHYKQYQNEQTAEDRASYASSELIARDSGKACLIPGAMPPWDYRRSNFFALYYPSNPSSTNGNYYNNIYPSGSNPGGSSPAGGGSVQVKGYTRKDGTVVRPHTRSSPRH